jgi:hypothetical protein
VQAFLQRELVERVHRQADEDRDAVVEHAVGIGEGEMFLRFGSLDRGRVASAIMDRAEFPVQRNRTLNGCSLIEAS